MPHFVNNASWTRHFNASLIASIGEGRKRENGLGYVHTAKLKDGGEIIIDSCAADDLTDAIVAVIPAAPGYNVIWAGIDSEDGPWTGRQAILAWQIRQSGEVRPVTVRGPNDGDHESCDVELPTGEVWCPSYDVMHASVDDYRGIADIRRKDRLAAIVATTTAEEDA